MLLTSSLKLVSTLLISGTLVGAQRPEQGNIVTWEGNRYSCKCYEGDKCWPSASQWQKLNATVRGNLHAVVPDPAVCYNTFEGKPVYNAEACKDITRNWRNETWQTQREVSNQWPMWTNSTCLPTDNPNDTCTLGFFPEYVIMAKSKEHIKAGVDFARNNNIRLVIRNTGHDFMGRSTGYGSLAINTHSFKSAKFVKKYTGPGNWRGGAVTVGAGIQGIELLHLAHQQNPPVIFVGGGCPTVGYAGGFLQGGGHGPLTTLYGMGADQALSFDVITADGRYVTANPATNSDLYWALKGGGPASFGVVVAVTVKTFLDKPSVGLALDINTTHTTDEDTFWKAYGIFHNLANHYVDNGVSVYYDLSNLNLHIRPFAGPNINKAKILRTVKPLFDQLKAANISFGYHTEEYPTFYDVYTHMFASENAGINFFMGGRIFTRRDITEHGNEIVDAKRNIAKHNGRLFGNIIAPGLGHPVSSESAVHPVWRDASSMVFYLHAMPFNATWEEKLAGERFVTEQLEKPLIAASPHGGAYVNEGNLADPDWQNSYWGSHYPRLRQLRKKWDPNGVFYARTTPGTEDWAVIDYGRKLCKKL